MADEKVYPVLVALKETISSVITTELFVPKQLAAPPVAIIELPDIARRGPDDKEDQLGAMNWDLSIPVVLYLDLRVAQTAQEEILRLCVEIISAIDADPSILNTVEDSAVTEAKVAYLEDTNRTLVSYEMTVSAKRLNI